MDAIIMHEDGDALFRLDPSIITWNDAAADSGENIGEDDQTETGQNLVQQAQDVSHFIRYFARI